MANKYIYLAASDDSITGKFRIIVPGFAPMEQKALRVMYTIGGKPDVSMGGVYEIFQGIARVRHTETESGYGDMGDLRDLYVLNDPGGTPSCFVKFQDHHYPTTSQKNVVMLGNFRKQIMGSSIEGEHAWFLVKIILHVIP